MPPGESVRRDLEIEEISNRWIIHPVAAWLTPRLARAGIHPNAVSLAGMGCGVLAGVAYHGYASRAHVLLGFLLMLAWHVLDGADGQLARLTGKQSPSGKVLDGICDYVTFIAVYVGLASALQHDLGVWVWPLAVVAGICHSVQSAAYEVQRQEYSFWGLDRASAAFTPASAAGKNFAARLYGAYLQLQYAASGVSPAFHARLSRVLAADPDRGAARRQRYRETFAAPVRRWAVLSANYRTLGIFLFAYAGRPQYYSLFEIVGFSAILLLLLRSRRMRYARFFAALDPA